MSKVLVTGASGFIGSHLAKRLLQDKHDVRILVRREVPELELLGAETVRGDLTDKESVDRAVEGIEIVYHVAAAFRKAKLSDSTYWDVNFYGAVNLFEAALTNGVSRFVHCSTVGVLGHIENPPADESRPYDVHNIYQITKSEAEKAALALHEDRGFPVTVIRPAGIYGPGDTRWLKLFKSIARRRFVMVGSGKTLIHMVYISDLVDAFILAAENPNAVGKVYIAAGERYVTLNELTSTIAKTVGVSDSFLHVPFKPVRVLSGVVEDVCKVLRVEPPIYRRRVDFFAHDRAFDITRARTELGYAPKVSLEEGIRRTADWYRERDFIPPLKGGERGVGMSGNKTEFQAQLLDERKSPLAKYTDIAVGRKGLGALLGYDLACWLASPMPGALGYFIRGKVYPRLLGRAGKVLVIGRNVCIRHPGRIHIGKGVVIDDNVVLDAKGDSDEGITIGDGVILGRNTIVSCKGGSIEIGDNSNISANCMLISETRLSIGGNVLIAGMSYIIAGGNHGIERTDVPIIAQPMVQKGGITVEDNCWLGANVTVLDGVTIGRDSVVGAGSVVIGNIPDFSIAVGMPARVVRNRNGQA